MMVYKQIDLYTSL